MRRVWSPADGPGVARQQVPPTAHGVDGDGVTDRACRGGLWAPSEGPVRKDPGGPGGEPNGRTIPIPGHTALNER
ncbi:MAG TPA: hypothetical protein VF904_12700 [Anaeromyxobacteraceae bacterium]